MERFGVARRTALCLAVLASLAVPVSGRAQGLFGSSARTPAPEAAQDSAQSAARPIPLSEIPLKADEALARLQTIATQLAVDPDLSLIEDKLPKELVAVSRSHERLQQIVMEHLSIRELWNLTGIWHSHEVTFDRWTRALEDELRDIERVAQDGNGIRDRWRLTSEALARADGVPRPLVERTDRVLAASDSLEMVIGARLSYLLGVKTELDDGLNGVRRVLADLEAARASVRGRMFSRGAPPLWEVTAGQESSASRTRTRIWSAEQEALTTFIADNYGSLLFALVLFLVFALLAVRLRGRIGGPLDLTDESLKGAAETLRRPVSAALLLTILATNAFWSRAPFIFWQAVALAAVVPLYRLLPRSRNPVINQTVRVLLVLFAVVAVADVFVPPSLNYRLVFLVVALALAGASGWLLRGGDPEQMRLTGWGTVVWRGLQVSLVAGASSFVANVLGWTMFAEVLLGGVLYSAYLGLGVVIGYRLIAGLIRLLPHTKLGQASNIMRGHGDLVTSRAIAVLKVVAFGTWIYLALEAFEVIDPVGKWVEGVLTGAIRVGAIEFSLEKISLFAVVVLLTIWIARLVAFTLDVEILPRFKLKRGVSNAISTVVQWTILGAGILTAGSALGLEAGQLAIVFGALSVGIGFGLQNIVSNFVSGLILIFEQPVKVGDKVEITSLSLTGEVQRIGIRASVVRTFDGAEVIVPNGNLISSEVVNWTLSDQRRRVRVEVGVAYGTDPHRVMEILKGVAVAHREVLKYPEPSVIFIGFGASSLDFRLLFWTATFDEFFRVRSEMSVAVHDALVEADITIPFPQRDLHFKSVPGPGEAVDLGTASAGGEAPNLGEGEPAAEPEGRV